MPAVDEALAELLTEVRALKRHAGRPWPEWLGIADLAAYLGGLSEDTVRLMVQMKKLPEPRQVPSYDRKGNELRATKALYFRADVDRHVSRWPKGIPEPRGGTRPKPDLRLVTAEGASS